MQNFGKSKRDLQSTIVATEEQEQLSLMNWAKYHPICKDYLIHIPNQRKCSPQYGKKLKLLGVKKGVSDLFLAFPNGKYHGLWIELKKIKGGNISPNQIEWMKSMVIVGYQAVLCHGWEEAKKSIEEYLNEC